MSTCPLKVHIAADDPLLSAVLAGLVTVAPRLELLSQTPSLPALAASLPEGPADLLLIGCEALGPPGDLPDLFLSALLDHAPVLLVDRRTEQRGGLAELLNSGISGIVAVHELSAAVLTRAARLVAGGGRFVSPQLAAEVLRAESRPTPPTLTARERQVVSMLAGGATSGMVARRLGIQVKTVKNHTTNAYAKLNVSNRGELRTVVDEGALDLHVVPAVA